MIDVNAVADSLLAPLENEGVVLCYQYPESFNELPVVSFYNLITEEGFRADCREEAQVSRVQIDIWAEKKTQPGRIAVRVNELMQNGGWQRELDRDLPKKTEAHVYHRTMRFAKEIFFGDGGE